MRKKMGNPVIFERRKDLKKIILTLIPKFLRYLYKYLKYSKLFPTSYVSIESDINTNNIIDMEGKNLIHKNVLIDVRHFSLGMYSTISGPTKIIGLGKVSIGKYCSIGPDVYIVTNNHNFNNFTTYPLSLLDSRIKESEDNIIQEIIIGNDVWIGRGVTILPGAIIGDGCIIAAGAVVTRGYYKPYSIIGGVPSRIIKDRIIESDLKTKLLELKWWDLSLQEILKLNEDWKNGLKSK